MLYYKVKKYQSKKFTSIRINSKLIHLLGCINCAKPKTSLQSHLKRDFKHLSLKNLIIMITFFIIMSLFFFKYTASLPKPEER